MLRSKRKDSLPSNSKLNASPIKHGREATVYDAVAGKFD